MTKVDLAEVGDGVSRVAIASTTGMAAEYARTDAWAICVTLAVDGDETQTGFSYAIARELGELGWEQVVDEAVERAVRMLGAVKPPTARVPIVLDQFAGMTFLGVLSSALSAEAVLKGRSLFAGKAGEKLGSDLFTLVDDGRVLDGPGACPFDDEGVPSRPHRAVHGRGAERVPARHVHGRADGRRRAIHGQRAARQLPRRARRRHDELLPRGRRHAGRTSCTRAPRAAC